MKVNNDNSGIWSGIKRLGSNTVYPAAFVVAGTIAKEGYQSIAANLQGSPLDTAKAVLDKWAHSAYASLTVENAKSLAGGATDLTKSVGRSVYNLAPEGSVKEIATTLSKYNVEIGTAAAIGASATLIDAVLKKVPKINHFGAVRVITSISLASAAVYAGANFGLEHKIDPKLLLDIAIKVGLVGAAWKVASKVTSFGFSAAGEGSYYTCKAIAYCFDKASYGELPRGAQSTKVESDQDEHRGHPLYKIGDGPWDSSPEQPQEAVAVGGEGGETKAPSRPATPQRTPQGEAKAQSRQGTPKRQTQDEAKAQSKPATPKKQVQEPEAVDEDKLVQGDDGQWYALCPDQKNLPVNAVEIEGKYYEPVTVQEVSFEGGEMDRTKTPTKPAISSQRADVVFRGKSKTPQQRQAQEVEFEDE